MYKPYLSLCKSRTGGGNHVLYSCLMHGDYIGITFHQETTVFLDNRLFGEIDTVKLITLMVNLTFRRVDIFGCFLVFLEHTATKGYDFSA